MSMGLIAGVLPALPVAASFVLLRLVLGRPETERDRRTLRRCQAVLAVIFALIFLIPLVLFVLSVPSDD